MNYVVLGVWPVRWVGIESRQQTKYVEESASLTAYLTAMIVIHVWIVFHAVMMLHKLAVSEV